MKIFHQSIFEKWPIEDKAIQAIITRNIFSRLRSSFNELDWKIE